MVCYICYALLLKYHKFEDMSWKSEMVISELIDKGIKITPEIVSRIGRHPQYSVTPVEYLSIGFNDTSEVNDLADKYYEIVVKEESIETEECEVQTILNGDMVESTSEQAPFVEGIIIKEEIEELSLEESIETEKVQKSLNGDMKKSTSKHGPFVEDIIIKEEIEKSIETENRKVKKNLNGDMRESAKKRVPLVEDIIIKEEIEGFWLEESIETDESEVQKNLNGYVIESTLKQEPFVEDIIIRNEIEELWLEEDIDVEGEVTLGYESNVKSEDIILEEQYVDIEHIDRKEEFLLPCSNKINKEPQKLKNHLNTQTEKFYTCDICSKTFRTKTKIKNHVTTHSQEKLYTRERESRQKKYLKKHLGVHTRDKPFICHICGNRFTDSRTLTRHLIVHADINNTDLETFACNICNKRFFRQYHLKVHLAIHTGSKPFKCSICKHSFSQKCSLIGHMRIHTGEKTHYCSKCNKGFYRKGHLHQHMTVHNEETHECIKCGKQYKSKRGLDLHACKLKTRQVFG